MKILIFHATAGHGHKKIAEVIERSFRERGLAEHEIQVADALDYTPLVFKQSYPALYYHSVKSTPKFWGWGYENIDLPHIYKMARPFRSLVNRLVGLKLLQHVFDQKPDVIICTHFLSAELFATAKGKLNAKLITVITDFFPHTFWVNEGTDFYWVMSEEGGKELQNRGVPKQNIVAGGIPVDDRFKPLGRRQEFLKKWNFEENRLTLLLTSGSFGLGPQPAILRALESFKDKIQCFAVCGMNAQMKKELDAEKYEFPVRVFGFVDFMPDLMEASDLVIAKSGGSTTTEALAKGVPMVVFQPIPGQETRNANLLRERNAAFFMQTPDQIKLIVQAILDHPEIMTAKKVEIQKLAKPNAADDLVSFVLTLAK
jgi:processive 1,2-diacylglycerol beta-glucosyltransferase